MLTHHHAEKIYYATQNGIGADLRVQIDLLVVGDEAVPELHHGPVDFSGCYIASLGDLMVLKGRAFVADRDKSDVDLADFHWIMTRIAQTSAPFNALNLLALSN